MTPTRHTLKSTCAAPPVASAQFALRSLLPRFCERSRKGCKEELADGRLMRVLRDWTCGDAQPTALVPYGQNQLPSVRALLDFLVQEVLPVLAIDGVSTVG